MKRRFWSDKEVELLEKMWFDREIDREQLATVFNRTWWSIQGKADSLGWKSRTTLESEWATERVLNRYNEMVEV